MHRFASGPAGVYPRPHANRYNTAVPATPDTQTWKCNICGQTLPANEFGNNRFNRSLLGPGCRSCLRGNILASDPLRYHRRKVRARDRGIQFDLTIDELSALHFESNDQCQYCGLSGVEFKRLSRWIIENPKNDPHVELLRVEFFRSRKKADLSGLTLDRIDPLGAYTKSNVVFSCWFCNSVKASLWSHGEMRNLGPLLLHRVRELCGDVELESPQPRQATDHHLSLPSPGPAHFQFLKSGGRPQKPICPALDDVAFASYLNGTWMNRTGVAAAISEREGCARRNAEARVDEVVGRHRLRELKSKEKKECGTFVARFHHSIQFKVKEPPEQ